jgi:hypothetical protein
MAYVAVRQVGVLFVRPAIVSASTIARLDQSRASSIHSTPVHARIAPKHVQTSPSANGIARPRLCMAPLHMHLGLWLYRCKAAVL